ncbi:hypothetical protein [Pseudomonas mosselii]|uniref:Uncharacterized protein n=1 Tax=Pseudomonas mosselii TaxID=78327 RepID=A0A7W2K0L2_9PSED|nr:hypothetical protein [Pseudomonas mosselii]MBA6068592.1 hypothetical protein [Pseudomonas mosselii]
MANIASSTVLSILPAYQGPTVAAGSYGLAPMQGYVKESADRLRQLVEQYGGTLALFGNATDVVTLRTNIGAAKSGANNDITALSGLTTALSISQGGTGGNTPAEARSGLQLKTGAVTDVTASGDDQTPGRLVKVGDKQACSAYVEFDGTGTPQIRGSYNVSAVSKIADGLYAVTFATPLAHAEYALAGMASDDSAVKAIVYENGLAGNTRSKNAFRICTGDPAGSLRGFTRTCVIVFGGNA